MFETVKMSREVPARRRIRSDDRNDRSEYMTVAGLLHMVRNGLCTSAVKIAVSQRTCRGKTAA